MKMMEAIKAVVVVKSSDETLELKGPKVNAQVLKKDYNLETPSI